MPNYLCDDCNAPVRLNQEKCKACWAELNWHTSTVTVRRKFVIWVSVILVWVVLVLIGLKVIWILGDKTAGNNEWNTREKLCEAEVLKQLKSPWSAKFWETRIPVSLGIKNYVDSQNSFWGLMRGNFVCMFNVETNKITVIFDSEEPNMHSLYESVAN